MLKDIIANYLKKKEENTKLTNLQIQQLNEIESHKHLMLRTGRTDKCLEPFNFYITRCLGCGLTNLFFDFNDPYSQAIQSIYLDAINKGNFELLTNTYYLDFNLVKEEYNKLISEGYSFEDVCEILKQRFDLKENKTLKRTKK